MSQTEHTPEVQALLARHATACDMRQTIDRDRITECLTRWLAGVSEQKLSVRFLCRAEELGAVGKSARAAWAARAARDARAAWDAWAARDARDARDAWAARDAWDAWAARDARAAWDAWAARDAWDAWAARDARAAWAARAAWDARDTSWDLSWISITAIGALSRADEGTHRTWLPALEAFEAGAWLFWITDREIVVAERPGCISVDENRRLHSADGYAFAWLDTIREAYWHGVLVPEYVVLRPAEITVAKIEAEANTEVRRVMIERYGQACYLVDSGAQEIHRDDYGVLYRKDIPGDEPLVMVKVVNSTPEPDGTYKDYFLRVPPTLTTARGAVAWTFGKEESAYAPLIET